MTVKSEPTQDDLDAIEKFKHQNLAISVKAHHRRRIFSGAMPTECTEQYAQRILGKKVSHVIDLSDAELLQLRESINKHVGV